MRISVAMASYNGAAHIAEQLDSLAAQTRPPDEIVISDDGSTDGTRAIVADWAAAHPGIALRLLEGRGPGEYSGNFIRAFAQTTGDLVFPCDQDDVWLPEKIATMAALFEADAEALSAIHDLEITDGALKPVGQRKLGRAAAIGNPLRDYNVGMASALRGPFLRLCLDLPPGFSYDNWMHHCARALEGKRVIDTPLALYRRHGGNAAQGELLNAEGRQSPLALKLAYLRQVLRSDKSGGDIAREAEKTGQLQDWLAANRAALQAQGLGEARLAALATRLDRMAGLLARRRQIRARPRLLRLLPVARLAAEGGYGAFNGRRAALKDVLI